VSDTGISKIAPTAEEAEPLPPGAWIGLAVVLLAAFMELLDVTVVTVAAPQIQQSLHTSSSQVEWILAAYQLAFATGMVTGGRLGDIFGYRRIFVAGVAWFTLASLLVGLAPNGIGIVVFRMMQGLAAAIMFPQVVAIIHVTFTGKHRAAAFGALGAATGLAGVVGPLLGGALISLNILGLEWRPIFLINVPIGLIATFGALALVKEGRSRQAPRLDLAGAVLGTAAVVLVVFPLIEGRAASWAWWIWLLLALSVPAFGIFALQQRRVRRRGRLPVVDPELFRGGSFGTGLIVQFMCFAGISGVFLVLAIELEEGHQFSALSTGLAFLPIAAGTALASGIAIPLLPRLGKIVLQIGALVMILGMLGLIYTLRHYPDTLSIWKLAPSEIIVGLGLGMIVTTVNDVVLAEATGPSAGSGSGVQATVGQTGNAVGVAIIGAIFFGLLSGNAVSAATAEAPAMTTQLRQLAVPSATTQNLVADLKACFAAEARSSDPQSIPVACTDMTATAARTHDPALVTLVRDTLTDTTRQHFSTSMATSLFYEIVVYLIVLLLAFRLPFRRGLEAGTAH
jgi:EmrB/QacA subfamily drug resistance transporter